MVSFAGFVNDILKIHTVGSLQDSLYLLLFYGKWISSSSFSGISLSHDAHKKSPTIIWKQSFEYSSENRFLGNLKSKILTKKSQLKFGCGFYYVQLSWFCQIATGIYVDG